MKNIYTVLIIVLFIIFTSAFAFSIFYFQKSDLTLSADSMPKDNTKRPEYHFAIIAQNTDDPFWQSVKKGALEAARVFNVAVEFNGPRFTNIVEELQYLDIAIASRVDGIATHVLDDKQFTPLIDKAVNMNIPVVTIETDAKTSKRSSFIGTNSFKLGDEGGKLIAEAAGGKAKVAVILNSYSDDGENIAQNLRVAGFRDAIKNYPEIEIKTVQSSRMGIFSAEEVTQEILNKFPDVNAIFCTSSKDTIGAAQVIVDFNRVGDVTLIGYSDLKEVLRYVEKGVIYGTVISNPVNMGYESIKALVELKKKKRTSSYVDTGVNVVTGKNLAEYNKMVETAKGQDLLK